ncbi:FliO/MopB family protein [Enterocloster aldenensis]|uniref:FliO/MopB family protein n=1 Tax=Enterocloster aldenensis TaxID=358742 RepID=UPI000E4E438E|nr:flagellar protein FliO [Enterocloster aldenensis]
MAFLKILFYLIVLIVVLFLSYHTTRILGRGMSLKQRSAGMQVLDQMTVGRDSFLLVVKVQEEILLLGVSPAGITRLEKLDTYETLAPAETTPDFAAVLTSRLKARRNGDDQGKRGGRETQ